MCVLGIEKWILWISLGMSLVALSSEASPVFSLKACIQTIRKWASARTLNQSTPPEASSPEKPRQSRGNKRYPNNPFGETPDEVFQGTVANFRQQFPELERFSPLLTERNLNTTSAISGGPFVFEVPFTVGRARGAFRIYFLCKGDRTGFAYVVSGPEQSTIGDALGLAADRIREQGLPISEEWLSSLRQADPDSPSHFKDVIAMVEFLDLIQRILTDASFSTPKSPALFPYR